MYLLKYFSLFIFLITTLHSTLEGEAKKQSHILYDHLEQPKFLKLYLPYHWNTLDLQLSQEPFKDSDGEFILLPILLNCWICPVCGNLNFNLVDSCLSRNCLLVNNVNRKNK